MFDNIEQDSRPVSSTRTEQLNRSRNGRKKKNRRSISKKGAIISVVLVILLIAVSMFLMKVSTIETDNSAVAFPMYSDAQIAGAAGIDSYQNLLLIKTDELKAKIEKELPYLEGISVTKNLHGCVLTVHTSYAEPAFTVYSEKNNCTWVLSSNCKILETTDTYTGRALPVITGQLITSAQPGDTAVFADERVNGILTEFTQMLGKAKVTGAVEYDLSEIRDIKVKLKDGGTLLLGSWDSVSEMKIAMLADLYRRVSEENRNNLYIINVKTVKDGYVKHLDETVPEETTEEETTEEETTGEQLPEETTVSEEEPAAQPEETTAQEETETQEETTRDIWEVYFGDGETRIVPHEETESGEGEGESESEDEAEGTTGDRVADVFEDFFDTPEYSIWD